MPAPELFRLVTSLSARHRSVVSKRQPASAFQPPCHQPAGSHHHDFPLNKTARQAHNVSSNSVMINTTIFIESLERLKMIFAASPEPSFGKHGFTRRPCLKAVLHSFVIESAIFFSSHCRTAGAPDEHPRCHESVPSSACCSDSGRCGSVKPCQPRAFGQVRSVVTAPASIDCSSAFPRAPIDARRQPDMFISREERVVLRFSFPAQTAASFARQNNRTGHAAFPRRHC